MKALMNFSIKKKFVAMSLWGVVLLSVTMVTQNWVRQESEAALRGQMEDTTARIALDVYNMVMTQDKLLRVKLRGDLAIARDLLAREGDMSLAEETILWKAVNQLSRKETDLPLPLMMVGKTALRQNRQKEVESAVVDTVRSLVGGTCTVFQRMNPQGDMLRVSTNVMLASGERAIGTFIPATHPDGVTDPIIASVLKGDTYVGRAFVVNAW
jgi:methyl-accepting chemotaxis protein